MPTRIVRAIVVAHVPSVVVAHHEPGLSVFEPVPSLLVLDAEKNDWILRPETDDLPEPGTQVRLQYRWLWVWFFGWRILRYSAHILPDEPASQ
jgi:hypothetical protein